MNYDQNNIMFLHVDVFVRKILSIMPLIAGTLDNRTLTSVIVICLFIKFSNNLFWNHRPAGPEAGQLVPSRSW